jgi:hypothetical protein
LPKKVIESEPFGQQGVKGSIQRLFSDLRGVDSDQSDSSLNPGIELYLYCIPIIDDHDSSLICLGRQHREKIDEQ